MVILRFGCSRFGGAEIRKSAEPESFQSLFRYQAVALIG